VRGEGEEISCCDEEFVDGVSVHVVCDDVEGELDEHDELVCSDDSGKPSGQFIKKRRGAQQGVVERVRRQGTRRWSDGSLGSFSHRRHLSINCGSRIEEDGGRKTLDLNGLRGQAELYLFGNKPYKLNRNFRDLVYQPRLHGQEENFLEKQGLHCPVSLHNRPPLPFLLYRRSEQC